MSKGQAAREPEWVSFILKRNRSQEMRNRIIKRKETWVILGLMLLFFLSVACGGGGVGGTDELIAGGGIGGTDEIIASNVGSTIEQIDVATTATLSSDVASTSEQIDVASIPSIEIQAIVDSISISGNMIGLLENEIFVETITIFIDSSSSPQDEFSLENIAAGDYLKISAYQDSGNILRASRVDLLDFSSNSVVKAPIISVDQPNFTLLNIQVQTIDGSTSYRDSINQNISQQDFFGNLSSGNVVEATGMMSGNIMSATEVRLVD